ncbi:hypothetical protein M3Y96_00438400 [Aphelenchoides besseyi]|nr:hypothetical protein M3Y96_00438400 [Aphelenchoides besseyi]
MDSDFSLSADSTTSNEIKQKSRTRLDEVISKVEKLRGDKRKIGDQTQQQYELIGNVKKWKADDEKTVETAESMDIESSLKVGNSLQQLSEILKDVDLKVEHSEDDDTIISTDIENAGEGSSRRTVRFRHNTERSKKGAPPEDSFFKNSTNTKSKIVANSKFEVRKSINKELSEISNKRLSLPTNYEFLTIENGTSNCFLAVSMNLIYSMTEMVEALKKIPPISPKIMKMLEVLEHRTHSVDGIRIQLGQEFIEGNQSVSNVLQILLNKWIPKSLHSFYQATFEKYHQCTNGIKKKTWQNTIYDSIIKSDNLLKLLLEETKEVFCNDCYQLVEPRIRLSDENHLLKYLVVAFAKQRALRIYVEDDKFESMGRTMRILTLVEYKKDIEHFVCWRRVKDQVHPWRVVDSLSTEPLKEVRLKQPFFGLSVMLLEIIPKASNLAGDSEKVIVLD